MAKKERNQEGRRWAQTTTWTFIGLVKCREVSAMCCHAMASFWNYLRHHVRDMEQNVRLAPRQVAASLRSFLLWVVPSASFVIAVDWLSTFTSTVSLTRAIAEGMSVTLWNVFGCIGLSLFGAALLSPRTGTLARAAHQMLIQTFGLGGLNYGLLLGFCLVSVESFSAA